MKFLMEKRFSPAQVSIMMAAVMIGIAVIAYASLPYTFQNGTVADATQVNANFQALDARIAALEAKLLNVTRNGTDLTFSGMNVRIVNGTGATSTTNGLGNLIVGYNELRGGSNDNRTGSHNIAVGTKLNYSSYGGLVAGLTNAIYGQYASVTGGSNNSVHGNSSSIAGGDSNDVNGPNGSILGGWNNYIVQAAQYAAIVGGTSNQVAGTEVGTSLHDVVVGGYNNTSNGQDGSTVVSGSYNSAGGVNNVILGGKGNTLSQNAPHDTTSHDNAIVGGETNQIYSDPSYPTSPSVLVGGLYNVIGPFINPTSQSSDHDVLVGGYENGVTGTRNVMLGGATNVLSNLPGYGYTTWLGQCYGGGYVDHSGCDEQP